MPVRLVDGEAFMPAVQRISRSMIEETVKRMGLAFQRDTSGDIVVRFGHSEEWGSALDVQLQLEEQTSIYTIRVRSDRYIGPADRDRCVYLCNAWNGEHRWPKAFLELETWSDDEPGAIYLEEFLDLREGVHQELLEDFTATVLWTADQFWQWMNGQLQERQSNARG